MAEDFSGQNLQNDSFKGQDLVGANFTEAKLEGADFSYADLRSVDFTNAKLYKANFRGAKLAGATLIDADFREACIYGADFTDANLTGADFSYTKAGLQRRWIIFLIAASGIITVFSGFSLYTAKEYSLLLNITLLVLVVIFLLLIKWESPNSKFKETITIVILAVVYIGFFALLGVTYIATTLLIGCIFLTIFTLAVGFEVGTSVMAILVTLTCSVGIVILAVTGVKADAINLTLFEMLFSIFTSWRILARDKRVIDFDFISPVAISLAARLGTNFQEANLTNAKFIRAVLSSTNFKNAKLTHTCWLKSKKLDWSFVRGSILMNSTVRNLLINKQGKSFVGLNLKGAYLAGMDLKEADFTEADISGATLEGTCLERTNLTKTQALGTKFNQAILTGACLEAWNIDSTTQLDGAVFEYVYLLNNQQERRPSSGEFAPGEFTKLFQEVLNTVDLIFRDGIDWKAFTYSFNELILDNEGTELEIQSIENKGDGVVVVRVSVPPDANKAKIHSEFNQNYEVAIKAIEDKYKAKLRGKKEQIKLYRRCLEDYRQQYTRLDKITENLAKQQDIKINIPMAIDVKATVESKAMNESADESRKIEISGNVTGSTLNLGEISGTVTTTINQLPDSPQANQAGIKELLTQLQTAIEAENDLPQEDKVEALEQVKVLAEAGKNPQEGAMQKTGKTAIKILKGTITGLPNATKLVEECNKLLPLISKLLGLG